MAERCLVATDAGERRWRAVAHLDAVARLARDDESSAIELFKIRRLQTSVYKSQRFAYHSVREEH